MEEKARIESILVEPYTRKTKVTIVFENRGLSKTLEKYLKTDLCVNIKKYFRKRTLNANSYAWALITELADVMRLSKEEVYFLKLKEYGQSKLVLITEEANPKQFFKYYSIEGKTTVKGKNYIWYKLYKGTSEYDSREMSIFIDGLIQDCEEQGIETKTKEEINSLIKEWEDYYGSNRFK